MTNESQSKAEETVHERINRLERFFAKVERQGSAYNCHFGGTGYHPLFLSVQFGDLERAVLRGVDHAIAKFWRQVLSPVIERNRRLRIPKFFRGDAACANPVLSRVLEKER